MKKRIFLLVIVILLTCAMMFVACGDDNASNDNNNNQENNENIENNDNNQNSNSENELLNTPFDHYVENGNCIITGMGSYSDSKVIIPESVDGIPVTAIAETAFANCLQIESLKLPASIKDIGEGAFFKCANIKQLDIPSLSFWCNNEFAKEFYSNSEGDFENCDLLINGEKVSEIITPNDITRIPEYAFRGFNITSITVTENIETIERHGFYDIESLKKIIIPTTVTNLGSDILLGCWNIEYADIPYKVMADMGVSKQSFKTLIVNTTGVDKIDSYAFDDAEKAVTSITISSDVKEIGTFTFADFTELKAVIFEENSQLDKISYSMFSGCTSLESIVLPNSIITIENSAFKGCTNLKNITFSNNITAIGSYAFTDCSAITKIAFDKNSKLEEIGSSAFSNCRNLKEVIISDSVKRIKESAFRGCVRLEELYLGSGITDIEACAFYDCHKLEKAYYNGSSEDWENNVINEGLDNVKAHFNTKQP